MLLCFGRFIPSFPAFSSAFLSLSLLFPVSGFAQTLQSLSEFFLLAFAVSFSRGAGAPQHGATQSAPAGGWRLPPLGAIIDFSSYLLGYIQCVHLDTSHDIAVVSLSRLLASQEFTE